MHGCIRPQGRRVGQDRERWPSSMMNIWPVDQVVTGRTLFSFLARPYDEAASIRGMQCIVTVISLSNGESLMGFFWVGIPT